MSSIPAAGVAKSLMVITISLHPGIVHQARQPHMYTVRAGDTLSRIAGHRYGRPADWPMVWWANRSQVRNPALITVGERLRLPSWPRVRQVLARAARAAQAAPPAAGGAAAPPAAPGPAPASSGGVNWAAIAACESGGDWSADTGNGFYGGLQFTEQTWLGYGGGQYAPSANLASAAQQMAVADRVLAGQGLGAWPVCGADG